MNENFFLNSFPSLSKAKAKYFCDLKQKKYRKERKEFLIEGIRTCYDLLDTPYAMQTIIFSQRLLSYAKGKELLEKALLKKIEIFQTTEDTLQKIADTCQAQPVIACLSYFIPKLNGNFFEGNRFLVLCDINDPGNVGTLLRTAEAFGWNHILCTGSTAEIYNPKVVRASMGAMFRIKIAYAPLKEIVSFLERLRITTFITMPHQGSLPSSQKAPEKLALFLGSEAHGLSSSLIQKANHIIRLPMSPQVESLNVAIAGGILLFLFGIYPKNDFSNNS